VARLDGIAGDQGVAREALEGVAGAQNLGHVQRLGLLAHGCLP
jgi:hypothetical protein